MTDSPTRVLLADDHPAFRAGVRARLEREADFEIVGEAGTGTEALALTDALRPDVLLLDMEMPDGSGADVVARLQGRPDAPHVLVLSAFDEADYVFAVLEQGAAGYLTKHEPLNEVVEAVRGVARGEMGWLSRKIAALLLNRDRAAASPAARDAAEEAFLSEREREVLVLLAEGLPNPEIGDRLFISENTVKKHVNALYEKLGVPTRAAAVAWAWRHGLVHGHAVA